MPWLFPFMVATSCITIVFLLVIWYLIVTFKLFADVMILGNVIMFALWLTGLIETGIQLFGQNSLNQTCIEFVFKAEYKGPSLRTLAWLEQASICE
ncbi:hypothetical protein KEM55_001967 [Ascosphaera atra]|nr:hypothetical protein KEM55_001967 [Ascosphaera atra]